MRGLLAVLIVCVLAAPLAAQARLDPDARLERALEGMLGPRQGTVLVYEPRTGRVRAAVHPSEAFAEAFPPGSLMKVVTAAALLESRAASPSERVVCRDRVEIAGRAYTCGYPGGHGVVDLRTALERSCSIYFYVMAQRVSDAALLRAARLLGVGSAAGAPWPRAAAGRLQVDGSVRRRTLAAVGEGDGVRMSPWQAAEMMARVSGMRPCGLRADTQRFLRAALRDAVEHGTGRPAAVPGRGVFGKTGTAEWVPGRPQATCGWFAGWSGGTVVVVFLREGQGRDAAALAARALQAALSEGGQQ